MAKDWFYAKDGQRFGPVSENMLRSLIAGSEIRPHDLVWTDGQKDWKAAKELLSHLPSPVSPAGDLSNWSKQESPVTPRGPGNVTGVEYVSFKSTRRYRLAGSVTAAIALIAILLIIGNGVRGYLSSLSQPGRGTAGVDFKKKADDDWEVGSNADNRIRNHRQESNQANVRQESASPTEALDQKGTDYKNDPGQPDTGGKKPEDEKKVEPFTESKARDAQRDIAEWVLSVGGSILVQDASGAEKTIRSVESLPFGSLTILKIDLTGVKEVMNSDLQKLKDAPQLIYLSVMTTSVSDEGLTHLQAIPSLEELNVAGTRVTGNGFRYLSGLRALRTLNCGGCPITDASLVNLRELPLSSLGLIDTQVTTEGARHLKTMPTLRHLRLSGTTLTDQGLKELSLLTSLETLMVDRTKVTEAGVRSFKAAVPGCAVRYTSKAGVTMNERGVASSAPNKGGNLPTSEPSFVGKYQVAIVNVENGRVQKPLEVEVKEDKTILVSDGTKGEWTIRNKRLVVKADALYGGLILTKQTDGSLVGEMMYAPTKVRYRMTLGPVSP